MLECATVQQLFSSSVVQSLNWIRPQSHAVSICYFQGLDLIKWPEFET